MAVRFHNEETSFRLIHKRMTAAWITSAVESEGLRTGAVNVVLCSDPYLLRINNEYLSHNYYTDVITFDYTQNGIVSGDLFVSVDTVADNAREFGTTPLEEMRRVIIHGILHLCGYGDKTDSEAAAIHSKEDLYLAKFPR